MFIVLPLTVEPTKPRLCHDARYLNLWLRDMPFSLDGLGDLRVRKGTYQTALDDKSGYDHILSEDSHIILGFNGASGILFIIHFLLGERFPRLFTILLVCCFFRAPGIPCLLYIDDRQNGKLQVTLDKGEYATLNTANDRHLAAAGSAIFFVAYHFVRLG